MSEMSVIIPASSGKNNYLFPLAKKKTTVYLLPIRLGKLSVVKI
ncbi:MAG TPA: hypothetical protein VFT15_07775 [Chitinophagaceae bacterium]|nr:hypothetical protein [Chitinophagaceae bacterium]